MQLSTTPLLQNKHTNRNTDSTNKGEMSAPEYSDVLSQLVEGQKQAKIAQEKKEEIKSQYAATKKNNQ